MPSNMQMVRLYVNKLLAFASLSCPWALSLNMGLLILCITLIFLFAVVEGSAMLDEGYSVLRWVPCHLHPTAAQATASSPTAQLSGRS